jgi:hypothetical protein
LDAVEIGTRAAPEDVVGIGDCLQSGSLIEVANVTGVVLVDPQNVMCLYVAHEVEAEDHAGSKFMLRADVH